MIIKKKAFYHPKIQTSRPTSRKSRGRKSNSKKKNLQRPSSGHCLVFDQNGNKKQTILENKNRSREIFYNLNHVKRMKSIKSKIVQNLNCRLEKLSKKIDFYRFYDYCCDTAYVKRQKNAVNNENKRKHEKSYRKVSIIQQTGSLNINNNFEKSVFQNPRIRTKKVIKLKKKKRKNFGLSYLSKDSLLRIFEFLTFSEYFPLSHCCKEFYILLNSNYIWKIIYTRRKIEKKKKKNKPDLKKFFMEVYLGKNEEKKVNDKDIVNEISRNTPFFWKRQFLIHSSMRKTKTKIFAGDVQSFFKKKYNEALQIEKIQEYFKMIHRNSRITKGYITVNQFETFFVRDDTSKPFL